jgi:hypothetical protein
MTPKEKAKELVKKYLLKIKIDTRTVGESDVIISNGEIRIETAKHCALIAVDELIIEKNKWENGSFYTSKYWDYVKQEIEKL